MNDLLALMHDTMGDLARIQYSVNALKDKEKPLTEEEKLKFLSFIEKSEAHMRSILDKFYLDNKDV